MALARVPPNGEDARQPHQERGSRMAKQQAYLDYLARIPMFSTCTRKELGAVARRSTDVTFPAGEVLMREGEPGYEAFVIVDGAVQVAREGSELAVLGAGDFFGELALLDRAPRTATVTTLAPTEAVVLTLQEFDALLEEAPTISRKLLQGLARRLAEVDRRVS